MEGKFLYDVNATGGSGMSFLYDAQAQLAMAVMLPLLMLIIGIPLIFVLCRWRHRRRMDELNARERFLSYEGDIHAEPVGDSTLQVSLVTR